MESKLEKEVWFLKVYAIAATLVCVVFIASAFTLQSRKQKFEEIDVERINIVEKDGKLNGDFQRGAPASRHSRWQNPKNSLDRSGEKQG